MFWVFLSFVPSDNYPKCLLTNYACITISKSLPIPFVAHESQFKNDWLAENQDLYCLKEMAGRYLHFSPCIQIAIVHLTPWNTQTHPFPKEWQKKSLSHRKRESLPDHLASLRTQMRGAAFRRQDSQGSPCPANFKYLPHSLKRNTKMK